MARLGGPPSGESSRVSTPPAQDKTLINNPPAPTENTAPAPPPVTPKVEPKITNEPAVNPKPKPQNPPPAAQQEANESEEDNVSRWMNEILGEIFEASINPHSEGLFLNSLYDELSESNSKLLSVHVESIFMEILTTLGVPRAKYAHTIDFLYSVYTRTFRAKRQLLPKEPFHQTKVAILNQIIKFSTSFGFICFQIPDMFLDSNLRESIDFFLNRFNDVSGYLVDVVLESAEQDALLDFLNLFLPSLSAKLYKTNVGDRLYSSYLTIFETLVGLKPVAAVFSKVDGFQPKSRENGLDFEHGTLLGPLLRLSPLDPQLAVVYFGGDIKNTPKLQIGMIAESLQNEHMVIIDRLYFIVDKLVRGSAQTRKDLMNWFTELVNLSHLRRGTHADFKTLPSDAIMFNISVLLIKLSLPFLDYPNYSKIAKIDELYLFRDSNLKIADESRVNASVKESDEFKETLMDHDQESNFITQCFFLTLTYLHFGIGGVDIQYDRLKKELNQFQERISMIQNNQTPPGINPQMMSFMRQQLPQLIQSSNSKLALKCSMNAVFNNIPLQHTIFDFIIGSTTFFVKLIDPSREYPAKSLEIPLYQIGRVSELDDSEFLKTKSPKPWKYYPEYLLEGVINYCKFSANFRGCPLVGDDQKTLLFVEFAIVLLRCPELIGNPHLKSSLVEVLFIGALPLLNGSPGFLLKIFNTNKLVVDNILYSLLDFYVMVEKTGSSSQFYDKFNSRYYVSMILEELWKNPIFRSQLSNYSVHNVDFFIRFIARMLNDTTYLLDESFNHLNSIHTYQVELKRRAVGEEPNEELGNDEELAKKLEQAERFTKSEMGLCNKTIELFKLFTKEVPQGFALPEIVDRLAAMLNYNLATLVGPKCSNLKVEDPEKYSFNPKKTLSDLCEIYCNLAKEDQVVTAVSRDGRSFNIAYFQKAERILVTRTYTNPEIIQRLMQFANCAEEQRQTEEDEELQLGEIPDEFLDPLMFSLMEDPVILPSSRVSIDRSTIKAHLLSDPTDPFNRMPLKLEDVVDDNELKAKIEAFKNLKRG